MLHNQSQASEKRRQKWEEITTQIEADQKLDLVLADIYQILQQINQYGAKSKKGLFHSFAAKRLLNLYLKKNSFLYLSQIPYIIKYLNETKYYKLSSREYQQIKNSLSQLINFLEGKKLSQEEDNLLLCA